MTPKDVEAFVSQLQRSGLEYLRSGNAIDIAVVDQIRGPLSPCSWLEFGLVGVSASETRVAACRFSGSRSTELITPNGWTFGNSLSASYGFVPTEHVEKSLKHLRRDDGLDVYLNLLTGDEVYVGRTSGQSENGNSSAPDAPKWEISSTREYAEPDMTVDREQSGSNQSSHNSREHQMEHAQFVQCWRAGTLQVDVDRSKALQIANSAILPKRYQVAHIVWSWIWILSIPAAAAIAILYKWWVGLLLLVFVTPALSASTKKSAMQFVIEHAVESREFYSYAISTETMRIKQKR